MIDSKKNPLTAFRRPFGAGGMVCKILTNLKNVQSSSNENWKQKLCNLRVI